MNDTIESMFALLREATSVGGRWYAVAVAAVVVLIRIYRRTEIQGLLPVMYRWDRIALLWRLAIVFLAAAGAAWVTATLGGQSLGAAALSALAIGIAAIGSHRATKTIGYAHTARALERHGALYEPGSIRTALEPILPIDRKAIDEQWHLAASVTGERHRSG